MYIIPPLTIGSRIFILFIWWIILLHTGEYFTEDELWRMVDFNYRILNKSWINFDFSQKWRKEEWWWRTLLLAKIFENSTGIDKIYTLTCLLMILINNRFSNSIFQPHMCFPWKLYMVVCSNLIFYLDLIINLL